MLINSFVQESVEGCWLSVVSKGVFKDADYQ